VGSGAGEQDSTEATGVAGLKLAEAARHGSAGALAHADDLLAAARMLLESHPHLAYRLGVLALEEVGRSTLIVVGDITRGRSASSVRLDRDTDDHVRKLFWALWVRPSARNRSRRSRLKASAVSRSRSTRHARPASTTAAWRPHHLVR
jgi:AbiV family abortive infection protein